MNMKNWVVVAAVAVVGVPSIHAAQGYTLIETIKPLAMHAQTIKASYQSGALTQEQVIDLAKQSLANAVETHLGPAIGKLQAQAAALTPAQRTALVAQIHARLAGAIKNLNIAINYGGLHDVASEITFGLRYVHDDLKLMPSQLEGLYQKAYAFAETNPDEVNKVGRAVRQLLIRLRDGLVKLQQKQVPTEADILQLVNDYKARATRALDVIIIPFIKAHPEQVVAIYNALSQADFNAINFEGLKTKLGKVAGKTKFA